MHSQRACSCAKLSAISELSPLSFFTILPYYAKVLCTILIHCSLYHTNSLLVMADLEDPDLPNLMTDDEAGDSDNVEIGGRREEVDSDSVEIGGRPARRDHRQGPRIRSRKKASTQGTFFAALLEEVLGRKQFFGVAQLDWALSPPSYGRGDTNDCGTIFYTINGREKVFLFTEPVAAPDGVDLTRPSAVASVQRLCGRTPLDRVGDQASNISQHLAQQMARIEHILVCTAQEATRCKSTTIEPLVFRTGRITARWRPQDSIAGFPTKDNLRLWRRQIQEAYGALPPEQRINRGEQVRVQESHLLYLPPAAREVAAIDRRNNPGHRHPEIDPVRKVHAISVVQHLRTPRLFRDVLRDSQEYFSLEGTLVEHDESLDPQRTTLMESLARADIVSCNLTRRLFRQWRHDDAIKSIHVYSDASPVVGTELQGMIIDIVFKSGSMERLILPGSTLAYGHCSATDKGVALLWALWLVAGPQEQDLVYACGHIRSLTTDFGVEHHLLEIPDITRAFIAWVGGEPVHKLRHLVQRDTRLFWRALRVAGWSHALGNIMKELAEGMGQWPLFIKFLRALCKFFRNTSYRQHIARALRHVEGIAAMMKKGFNANFLKWRYETVVNVMRELRRLRRLCEVHLNSAMFAGAQDQEEIKAVMDACRRKEFWRWIEASYIEIFSRLETLRKWGMVCDHARCEEIRQASGYKKHVQCPRTSNRICRNNVKRIIKSESLVFYHSVVLCV